MTANTIANSVDFLSDVCKRLGSMELQPASDGVNWSEVLRIHRALPSRTGFLPDQLPDHATFVSLTPFCEPQLGVRGMYHTPGASSLADAQKRISTVVWILGYSDGRYTLGDIERLARNREAEFAPKCRFPNYRFLAFEAEGFKSVAYELLNLGMIRIKSTE